MEAESDGEDGDSVASGGRVERVGQSIESAKGPERPGLQTRPRTRSSTSHVISGAQGKWLDVLMRYHCAP